MPANHANRANFGGEGAEEFVDNAAAENAVPPEKKPLFRELPPPPPFPVDALGPLKEAVLAMQELTQAPLSLCANSATAAATLAAQSQRDVLLPGPGRRPISGIFITVADSGERKSSVDRIALKSVYKFEEELRAANAQLRSDYLNAKEAWDTARAVAKRNKKSAGAIKAALDEIGPEPKEPPPPMLLLADATPEAKVLHLAARPTAGVFTAEGGVLLGGHAFNDEAKTRTAALFNVLWDGDPIRRSRVLTGEKFLPGRRCTFHIMVQPVAAQNLFNDPVFDGIGLLARMLLSHPESTAGTRLHKSPSRKGETSLEAYHLRVYDLLTRPPVTQLDSPDVLDPPVMRLSPEAQTLWIEFHDKCETGLAEDGALSTVRAFASKLAEHAGRLAAVIAVYTDPDSMEVSEEAMRCGIAMAEYYAQEMLRLNGSALVSQKLRIAQKLLEWWQRNADPILHLANIYQLGPSSLRDKAAAKEAVEILIDHGWVVKLRAGTVVEGKARKEAYQLISQA